MSWKPKQGEMIIVWNNTGIEVEREFVAMTPDNKYISYTKNKHDVSLWEHAEPINKFKELKKCYELGAKFEYRLPSKTGWSNCLFKNEYILISLLSLILYSGLSIRIESDNISAMLSFPDL